MSGILSEPLEPERRRPKPQRPQQPAEKGLTVRHRTSGVVGTILRFSPQRVVLVDRSGREHALPVADGAFSVGGRTVDLVRPAPSAPAEPSLTASGSIKPPRRPARVAAPSRILVEGLHDADLVEKIWGEDLREEGVVVEPLHGADDLRSVIEDFAPSTDRRLGILLDHMVDHTKEWHLAREAMSRRYEDSVLITGHEFVDIWAAVRPRTLGIERWPDIPRGTDWKEGVRDQLGFRGSTGELWRRILGSVNSYRDLDPSLVGAVEQLIDFVAPPPPDLDLT